MSLLNRLGHILKKRSFRRQMDLPRPDPALWDLAVNDKGELTVNGFSCVELAKEHDTPLLVVHAQALRRHVAQVQSLMAEFFASSMIVYSYKTNCIPGIVQIMHELGVGAEVISGYEYWLAENLKVPPEKIVFNGVDKSRRGLSRAVASGALINIDNIEEVHVLLEEAVRQSKKARVGIRLGLSSGTQLGVFPDSEDMHSILKLLLANPEHVDLCALHFNTMSNAKHNGYHVACTKKALAFMRMLKEQHGVDIRILDIGGGMGVPTSKNMSGKEYGLYRLLGLLPERADQEPFQDMRAYLGDIAASINSFCREAGLPVPMVVIEPGRMLTSRAECMLARVKSIKHPPENEPYAITDAGRFSHAFPCDFEFHEALLANDMRRPLARAYTVTGRVCTRSDWLYRGKVLPELASQDLLAIMDAGAYFSSYAMNFAFPRAQIVAVEDDCVRVLRRRESFAHLTAMDEVELAGIEE